jgi:hypothetical protein
VEKLEGLARSRRVLGLRQRRYSRRSRAELRLRPQHVDLARSEPLVPEVIRRGVARREDLAFLVVAPHRVELGARPALGSASLQPIARGDDVTTRPASPRDVPSLSYVGADDGEGLGRRR